MRNWGAEDERARHCGSVAAVCRRFAHGFAVLLRWFALGLRMALRFCCGVLPRFTPVFFPLSGKKRRLAMSCVSIPPGRDRHSCVLAMSVWLSAFGRFTSGLCVSCRRSRRGYRGTGYGAGDVGFVHLCVITLALQCFPRGVRWGYAPPNLRQRVFDSLDSLHAAAGLCRRKFAALVRFCVITLALQCFPRGVRWG